MCCFCQPELYVDFGYSVPNQQELNLVLYFSLGNAHCYHECTIYPHLPPEEPRAVTERLDVTQGNASPHSSNREFFDNV